jgi:hypothetical protein
MMKRFLIALVALLTLPEPARSETVYHNTSSVTNKFVIADTFINDGYFEVQNLLLTTNQTSILDVSRVPYDTSDTKRYVNNGTIRGLSMKFDDVDEFGVRNPAFSFENSSSGIIDFSDGFHLGNFPVFQVFLRGIWESAFSMVHVDAKTIVNKGTMRIGAGGLLRVGHTNQVDGTLNADTVDLSTGKLIVDPVGLAYGQSILTTYDNYVRANSYLNDLGVTDVAWGMGTFTNQNQQLFVPQLNPTIVNVPDHRLTNAFGTRFLTFFSLDNATSFGYSFPKRDGTNIIVQVVYFESGDSNVVADVRWTPIAYYFNDAISDPNTFWTPIVKISAITTNALTLQVETNAFFIADQLGSETNFTILQNDRYPSYFRPGPYFITRSEPIEYTGGVSSNFVTVPSFPISFPANLYNPGFSNVVVTNAYAAYVFDLQNLVYSVPPVPDASVHDLPGRVEITGKTVDLTSTGIRGEGLISVKAEQFAGSEGAVLDSQNLAFDLAYTNTAAPATPLRIQNLAKDRVARLQGAVELWSGTFTNQFGDAQSNVFNVLYHVMVVDARGVTSAQDVSVAEFHARTANLRVDDNMIVSNLFDVTSSALTIAGSLELRGTEWGASLPNLTNLTVEPTGNLTLVGLSEFGTTARPLANFVNQGTIGTYSASIVADNVDISGTLSSGQNVSALFVTQFGSLVFSNFFQVDSGPLFINARKSARLTGATIQTLGNISLTGPVYKLDGSRIDAGSAITLNVTDALTDSGPTAGNRITSSNSFSLATTVKGGSLLGTEIDLAPPPSSRYRFTWAQPTNSDPALTNIPIGSVGAWVTATNRAYDAYRTNVGVGHLVLRSGTNTVFEFSGTQKGRALFVDLLEITGTGITNLASLTNQLTLVSNATSSIDIYFADVTAPNLAPNLPLGFQNLAEFLNGKRLGGGRLFWVGTYNGANSSEDVVVNGVSVRMNRPLRRSQIIDLDLDGIANGNDDLPFQSGVAALRVSSIDLSQVDGKVTVKFTAFKGSYQVQYTDSMQNPVWRLAGAWSNNGSTGQQATVTDTGSGSGTTGPRFYRLIYYPTP